MQFQWYTVQFGSFEKIWYMLATTYWLIHLCTPYIWYRLIQWFMLAKIYTCCYNLSGLVYNRTIMMSLVRVCNESFQIVTNLTMNFPLVSNVSSVSQFSDVSTACLKSLFSWQIIKTRRDTFEAWHPHTHVSYSNTTFQNTTIPTLRISWYPRSYDDLIS